MDNAVQRENFTFGGRNFTLALFSHGEQDYSVELIELGDPPLICYAADFLEEVDAEIEFERVLDDVAAFV